MAVVAISALRSDLFSSFFKKLLKSVGSEEVTLNIILGPFTSLAFRVGHFIMFSKYMSATISILGHCLPSLLM